MYNNYFFSTEIVRIFQKNTVFFHFFFIFSIFFYLALNKQKTVYIIKQKHIFNNCKLIILGLDSEFRYNIYV